MAGRREESGALGSVLEDVCDAPNKAKEEEDEDEASDLPDIQ